MTDVIRLPQPDELSEREKDDAMGAYLMMFATWVVGLPLPVLNLIAAVIYFYVNKKSSRFVAFHALQSLLSQVHARKGSFYYMPLFGRISFSRYYGPNAESFSKPVPPNRPPEGF